MSVIARCKEREDRCGERRGEEDERKTTHEGSDRMAYLERIRRLLW